MAKFIAALLMLTTLTTQAQQILTPELLWAIGRVSLEDVSPDGKMAVYGVTRYNVPENKSYKALYVTEIATGNTKRITPEDQKSGDAQFTPDNKRVGFLRGGNLYEVGVDGNGERQLSEQNFNGFKYAPNGQSIVFINDVKLDQTPQEKYPDMAKNTARISDTLFYRHWNEWHDYAYSHLFLQP